LSPVAFLPPLRPAAEALDPGGVTNIAEMYARAAAGMEEGAEQAASGDAAGVGGGAGGSGGVGKGKAAEAEPEGKIGEEEDGEEEAAERGVEGALASLPALSVEAQSILVDLGRAALKVRCSRGLGRLSRLVGNLNARRYPGSSLEYVRSVN